MNEQIKQPLTYALVESGLCCCFDNSPCHYHAEITAAQEREAKLQAEIALLKEQNLLNILGSDEQIKDLQIENARLRGERFRYSVLGQMKKNMNPIGAWEIYTWGLVLFSGVVNITLFKNRFNHICGGLALGTLLTLVLFKLYHRCDGGSKNAL